MTAVRQGQAAEGSVSASTVHLFVAWICIYALLIYQVYKGLRLMITSSGRPGICRVKYVHFESAPYVVCSSTNESQCNVQTLLY